MKSIFRVIIALFSLMVFLPCMAGNDDEITLIVTSDGVTKDEAIKNTLRAAIEQAYGVFVSANTDILNDELVRDNIATISSGNIKNFNEVAVSNEPDKVTTTLQVIVSKGKLLSYAKNKGAECELDGAALGNDIELQILYKKNEEIAVENLVNELLSQLEQCFDYEIFTDKFIFSPLEERWDYLCGGYDLIKPETIYNDNSVSIPFKVTANLNKNGVSIFAQFIEKLSKIGKSDISQEEKNKEYKKRRKEIEKLIYKNPQKAEELMTSWMSGGPGNDDKSFKYVFKIPFEQVEKDKNISEQTGRDFYGSKKKYPDVFFRSKNSLEMLESLFSTGSRVRGIGKSGINQYLSDFYIHLGDGKQDNKKIQTIGEDGILMYTIDGNYRGEPFYDTVKDEVGAEYFFRFGRINLPIEDVKKLRNIKVVHN